MNNEKYKNKTCENFRNKITELQKDLIDINTPDLDAYYSKERDLVIEFLHEIGYTKEAKLLKMESE